MPTPEAPRTNPKQRRLTALFAIRHRTTWDKYGILLMSGIALFALAAQSEPAPAEFRGEKG